MAEKRAQEEAMEEKELRHEVAERLRRVKHLSLDPEDAHIEEDGLYRFVLERIADGDVKTIRVARVCAKKALEARDVDFPRWCA